MVFLGFKYTQGLPRDCPKQVMHALYYEIKALHWKKKKNNFYLKDPQLKDTSPSSFHTWTDAFSKYVFKFTEAILSSLG